MERVFETKCGKIRGLDFEDHIEVKNVIYAYTKRFEYPVVATHWDEVIDGTKDGANVYQMASFYEPNPDDFYEKEFTSHKSYTFTEDYLTLDIVAPKGEKLPVLMFIHGGGYETGMVNDLPYGGSTAYVDQGVILVSISYRMNAFGLYNDGVKYKGNYGVADQIAAINWIRDNIDSFGGDGNKITLIGQSAGAMSVDDLCFVKELEGKVCGAVMMSGLPGGSLPFDFNFSTSKKSRAFWKNVERLSDCKNGDELKNIPPKRLFDSYVEAKKLRHPIATQFPIADGNYIEDLPKKLYKKGKRLNIPYIFGVTSQDMMIPDLMLKLNAKWAKLQKDKIGSPVYGYFFDKTPPGNSYMAFHAVDLWYVFGRQEKSWRPFDELDYKVHRKMVEEIAHFAKFGKPCDDWKEFSNSMLMCFDDEIGNMKSYKHCVNRAKYIRKHHKGPM